MKGGGGGVVYRYRENGIFENEGTHFLSQTQMF